MYIAGFSAVDDVQAVADVGGAGSQDIADVGCSGSEAVADVGHNGGFADVGDSQDVVSGSHGFVDVALSVKDKLRLRSLAKEKSCKETVHLQKKK